MCWPSPSNAAQLEILLGQMFTTPPLGFATCYNTMPRLQGRLVGRYCAYGHLY